jgi:hypothetical protein
LLLFESLLALRCLPSHALAGFLGNCAIALRDLKVFLR